MVEIGRGHVFSLDHFGAVRPMIPKMDYCGPIGNKPLDREYLESGELRH